MESVLTFWVSLAGGFVVVTLGFAAAAYRLGLRDGLLWGRSSFPEAAEGLSLHDSVWEVRINRCDASGKQHSSPPAVVRLRQFDSRLVGEPEPGSHSRWSCEAVTHGRALHLLTATSTPGGKRFASARLEYQQDGSFTGFELGTSDGEPGIFVRPFSLVPRVASTDGSLTDEGLPNGNGRPEKATLREPVSSSEHSTS